MTDISPDQRITLSRETLRAELSQLELRLVDRLTNALESKADTTVVNQLDARVNSLELSRASRDHLAPEVQEMDRRLTRLERFRYAVPSASFLSLLVTAALALFYFTHG